MKKTGKIVTLLMALALVSQTPAFAEGCTPVDTPPVPLPAVSSEPAPCGAYLWKGSTMIAPDHNGVVVNGSTTCFEAVPELSVTLILYRQNSYGTWDECWRKTYTAYNKDWINSPYVYVSTGPGVYKVGGIHTAGAESNTSSAGTVTIY